MNAISARCSPRFGPALALALLVGAAAPAFGQTQLKDTTRYFDHQLDIFVWSMDATLQPDAAVSVQQVDGTVAKAVPQADGSLRLRGWIGEKAVLEVEHATLGSDRLELALPDAPRRLTVHVGYLAPARAKVYLDSEDKPGDLFYGGGAADSQPSNDLCQDAIGPLAVPSVTPGTTIDATVDAEIPDCVVAITSPGVWYTTVGTGNTMTASVCTGTGFDSKISIYCGSCEESICVGGNDDFCGLQSQVSWCSEPGTEYLILVHGFGGDSGDFELTLADDGAPCDGGVSCTPPDNDQCEGAIPVAVPSVTVGSTAGATVDDDFLECETEITAPGVWYSLTGTGTTITVSTCGPLFGYDTKLSVYCSGCTEPLCVAGNDDDCDTGASALLSTVSFCSQAGVEYLVLVHGFGGAFGDFELYVTEDGVACAPDVPCIPIGACCLPDGTCVDGTTEGDCGAAGGAYQGDGVLCEGGFLDFSVEDCNNPFEDISGTGSPGPTGDDDSVTVPIGFDLDFFGDTKNQITISSNGYLTFGPDGTDLSNDVIPDPEDPNDAIFVLWDDLNPVDGGAIYYQTLGAAPNRRLVVQWDDVPEFGTGGADRATFQAVLHEDGSVIDLRYLEITGIPSFPGDVTVGVENADGTVGFAIDETEIAPGVCKRLTPSFGDPVDCGGCVTLDFETEDDGTPLVNGQDVSSPDEFGTIVSIDGSGPNLGAAIFDSTPGGPNATGRDLDLLVDLGNVLIVQDHAFDQQTVPGIFDIANDAIAGGTLAFDFVSPVAPQSVILIDIDPIPGNQEALVTLIDGSGRGRDYLCPTGWTRDVSFDGPPGYQTLDLTTLADQPGFQATATASEDAGFDQTDVVRMEVFFTSSAALDELVVCPPGN